MPWDTSTISQDKGEIQEVMTNALFYELKDVKALVSLEDNLRNRH